MALIILYTHPLEMAKYESFWCLWTKIQDVWNQNEKIKEKAITNKQINKQNIHYPAC